MSWQQRRGGDSHGVALPVVFPLRTSSHPAPPTSPRVSRSLRVLYNPASGRGRGARAIGGIRAAFAHYGFTDVRGTERSGDEARLVREALDDGIETIVVAGGDGTWSKCAVPLARAGSPARIALLAAGTGNDFAKNLGLDPRHPSALAKRLADGDVRERRVDMGRVDDHWFLNVAGFGFDAAVLEATQRSTLLRGPALYVGTALREILSYEGIEVRIDGAASQRYLLTVFSNGKFFGGTFRIAPDAQIDDARLDAILIDDVAKLKRPLLLASAISGSHVRGPHCTHRRFADLRLEFAEAPFCEIDGDLVRTASARVEVASVPAALRIVDH